MRPLESLTLESIVATLLAAFRKIDDNRDPARVKYALSDALMSGFTMMFFHHPSLLQYQERMKQKRGLSNLETIFQVKIDPLRYADAGNPGWCTARISAGAAAEIV
jgi:hypothetical protein